MSRIFKDLASITVWLLSLIAFLSLLISPIARYVTGDDLGLWIALGVSFIAIVLALTFIQLVQRLE